jgi:hypothetical protein
LQQEAVSQPLGRDRVFLRQNKEKPQYKWSSEQTMSSSLPTFLWQHTKQYNLAANFLTNGSKLVWLERPSSPCNFPDSSIPTNPQLSQNNTTTQIIIHLLCISFQYELHL